MAIKKSSAWLLTTALAIPLLLLTACGGGGGSGTQAPASSTGTSAGALSFTITSVTVASPPVVDFSVTDENDDPFPGLQDSDLRFNIAKLIPRGTDGNPSHWQNYILNASNNGSQERLRNPPRPGEVYGTLVNHGDGSYTYTFATDITTVAAGCSPCTTPGGTILDLSYQPALTHRLGIQQGNSALPTANAVCDFVPASGTSCIDPASGGIYSREITSTSKCNECHDRLVAHGSRYETRLCVTCHNPGSWADSTTPVDFKVMIHKIHHGEDLPSGDGYSVGNHDFSDVVFPQDIRNCDKCHDGADPETPQGDSWQRVPGLAACGSCHDDIDFSVDGSACFIDPAACTPDNEIGHPGGVVTSDSQCTQCHGENKPAGSVEAEHTVPGKAERAYFRFNILSICGISVDSGPVCADGTSPTVTFSVEDPSGNGGHFYGASGEFYNIVAADPNVDPEFASGSAASVTLDFAWKGIGQQDWTNDQGTGTRPSRVTQVSVGGLGDPPLHDNGDGTYTYTADWALPATSPEIGTLAVALEGRGSAPDSSGAYSVRVPVAAPVAYAAVNDAVPQPRRRVVDATTKCDRCHDMLSLHGGSRNDNGQLCVLCHNPNNTDVNQRPKDTSGLPDPAQTLDGKQEESVDFKRLIHGVHAAAATNYDGTEAHGFRAVGMVVYGYRGSEHDYSHLRFPGVLSKCDTCHLEAGESGAVYDTYVLADHSADGGPNWHAPAQNGIIGSTVHSYPSADPGISPGTTVTLDEALADQTDDLKHSPTAAVCSACHDGTLPVLHMQLTGNALFGASVDAVAGNVELCAECHGSGKLWDVELVHSAGYLNAQTQN